MSAPISKIRIVSDGTPQNTHVYDRNGQEMQGVMRVSFECGANRPATATVEFLAVEIDATVFEP